MKEHSLHKNMSRICIGLTNLLLTNIMIVVISTLFLAKFHSEVLSLELFSHNINETIKALVILACYSTGLYILVYYLFLSHLKNYSLKFKSIFCSFMTSLIIFIFLFYAYYVDNQNRESLVFTIFKFLQYLLTSFILLVYLFSRKHNTLKKAIVLSSVVFFTLGDYTINSLMVKKSMKNTLSVTLFMQSGMSEDSHRYLEKHMTQSDYNLSNILASHKVIEYFSSKRKNFDENKLRHLKSNKNMEDLNGVIFYEKDIPLVYLSYDDKHQEEFFSHYQVVKCNSHKSLKFYYLNIIPKLLLSFVPLDKQCLFSKEDFNFLILKKTLVSKKSHNKYLFLLKEEVQLRELDKIRKLIENHDSKKNVLLNIIANNRNDSRKLIYSNRKNAPIKSHISKEAHSQSLPNNLETTFTYVKNGNRVFSKLKNFNSMKVKLKKDYSHDKPLTTASKKISMPSVDKNSSS